MADAELLLLPVRALLLPAWPEPVPLGDEPEADPAPPPAEAELASPEPPPADPPPPAVPLDDDPPWERDPEEPEVPSDLVGLVTFGITDGTVTVGVETVGTVTCGTVTVTGADATVTVGASFGDALLVRGSTASGTMNPSAAARPAATHRNRPRPGDEGGVPRPAPLRRLSLPGIVPGL